MDIKAKIDEIVKKVQADPKLLENLTTKPAETIKALTGLEVTDQQINDVVNGVKTALAAAKTEGIVGGIGKLLGK